MGGKLSFGASLCIEMIHHFSMMNQQAYTMADDKSYHFLGESGAIMILIGILWFGEVRSHTVGLGKRNKASLFS